ncbi:MAG TPA: tRNA (N6-threonylcarbamoyladenosine(37)-N6)-methyltransferase TrmO [Desulfosalsimonadaceae bacterium]|nr:tRNA (N6-threonylcarbamoyladenosine(37)-N6)-methyltransferase TrmO [Desulfosalsimonadaceae bacterium]
MKSTTVMIAICAVCMALAFSYPAHAKDMKPFKGQQFTVHSIGSVHKENGRTTLVLDKEVEPALLGLEGFSHVLVFWWFDKNDTPEKRSRLQVHPRGNPDNPLTGVFATRSPVRPNLIALSLCRIRSVRGNVVEVKTIDAFAGTPILDLKPYIPGYDSTSEASVPDWVKKIRKEGVSHDSKR